MRDWRQTAKTIGVTFLVTSAAWLIGGSLYFYRVYRNYAPPSAAEAVVAGNRTLTAREAPPGVQPTLAAAVVPPMSASGLIIPVKGVRAEQLVDTFTQSRAGGRVHNAIDIMASRGTPVIAAAAGTVEKLFFSARGGNTIYVRSPDRTLIYYYAHLDSYAPGLAAGQQVKQGQLLGGVGFTGDASPDGPHLHFEIQQTTPESGWWQHSVSLNPYPLLVKAR